MSEAPLMTRNKASRLRYYRSSKAYQAKSKRECDILSQPCIPVAHVRQNVTVAPVALGSDEAAYPSSVCTLMVAGAATAPVSSFMFMQARAARERGTKL